MASRTRGSGVWTSAMQVGRGRVGRDRLVVVPLDVRVVDADQLDRPPPALSGSGRC